MNTLSFQLLDDLKPCITKHRKFNTKEELKNILYKLWDKFINEELLDSSSYFFNFETKEEDINHVYTSLLYDDYCVYNRFEKYYVIAFSINYKRFYIWSKYCNARLIDWGEKNNDNVDETLSPDWDENPIFKFIKSLNS